MHCGYSPTNRKPKAVLLSVHSESLLVPVFADKETQESPLSGCLWLSKHRHRPSPSPLRCDCLLFFFSLTLISPLLSVCPFLQSVLSVVILWPESLCFYTCTALLFPLFASCVASLYLSRVWASIVLGGGRGLGSPSGLWTPALLLLRFCLLWALCLCSVLSSLFFPFPYCMFLNERWIKQKKKKKHIVCFLYSLFTLFTLIIVCLIM